VHELKDLKDYVILLITPVTDDGTVDLRWPVRSSGTPPTSQVVARSTSVGRTKSSGRCRSLSVSNCSAWFSTRRVGVCQSSLAFRQRRCQTRCLLSKLPSREARAISWSGRCPGHATSKACAASTGRCVTTPIS
jgi:hypothetical protein